MREGLRTQMWPLPAVGIVCGVGLGIGLPRLDAHIDVALSAGTTAYLFGGGPSAARTMLGTIASSLITVTSLTFSLTVVTLQLASSQFSPRLLRMFTRDRFVHLTLALFLATFTYSLAVLRTVRDAGADQVVFVPQLSVTFAFVLCLLSVVGLVLFLAHLAQEIRVETMLRKVHADAGETMRRVLVEREPRPRRCLGPVPPSDAATLPAAASGFVVGLDAEALLAAALEADAIVFVECAPGSTVVAATPVGVAWPRAGTFDAAALERLRKQVADAVATGFERTAVQDVGYGLRQLVDVATKALSPGINDPTTAVHALGHCSALLCELTGRELRARFVRDEDEDVRVVLSRPGFAELLELVIAQPRHYGAADPFVLAPLFQLLREVAWCAHDPDQHQAVAGQLARLRATVAEQDFDSVENDRLAQLASLVEHAQRRRWVVTT